MVWYADVWESDSMLKWLSEWSCIRCLARKSWKPTPSPYKSQPSPPNACLILISTATVNAYTVASVGTSIPYSLAFLIGVPRITSTSNRLPSLASTCMLLSIPGIPCILSIRMSTSPYSSATPDLRATPITSRIKRFVTETLSLDEESHCCVSCIVSVVKGFQATFYRQQYPPYLIKDDLHSKRPSPTSSLVYHRKSYTASHQLSTWPQSPPILFPLP